MSFDPRVNNNFKLNQQSQASSLPPTKRVSASETSASAQPAQVKQFAQEFAKFKAENSNVNSASNTGKGIGNQLNYTG